jgi:hypothetical protein
MAIQDRSKEKNEQVDCDKQASSQGDQSRSVTPKDVCADDATHRDLQERKVTSRDMEEKAQAILDEAIEQTFPASDPIAVPTFEEALEIVKAQQAKDDAAQRGARR